MYPPVDPVLFQIGLLTMRWYGILLVAGMIAAAYVAGKYLDRQGQVGDTIWDMLVFVLIPALVGARLYYVFIQSPRTEGGIGRFLEHPWSIFQIWTGGIHIYGAFIFGIIAVIIFTRWRKLPVLVYLDAIGLAAPLGQAIGRLANFINQELYGPPTMLPWGLRIDPQHRISPYNDMATYPESVRFHPLFLYESLWNFAGFGLLFWISRRFEDWLLPGDLFLLYLIWYPTGRFMLEFVRTDSWFFGESPFNTVHVLSAIAVVTSVVILIVRHTRHGRRSAEPATRQV